MKKKLPEEKPERLSVKEKRTAAAKLRMLDAVSRIGNVTMAAKAAKIERKTHYRWLEADEEYRKAFDVALSQGIDAVEAKHHRLAVNGWMEPVVSAGKVLGSVRKYDMRAMQFILQHRRPEIYGAKVDLKHSGEVKGGVLVVPGGMSIEEWEKAAKTQQAEASKTVG